MATELVSIILAAGEGRRLGGNKGLALLGGRPAIQIVVEATRAGGIRDILVVSGHGGQALQKVLAGGPARLLQNPRWPEGMTTSIQRGLEALPPQAKGFLIHPVDHLLVQADDIRRLVQAFEESPRQGGVILRPRSGPHLGHPVLFARSYAPEFLALKPEQPGHQIYRRHQAAVTFVEVLNPHIAFDMDTRDDLARAEQILLSRASKAP